MENDSSKQKLDLIEKQSVFEKFKDKDTFYRKKHVELMFMLLLSDKFDDKS